MAGRFHAMRNAPGDTDRTPDSVAGLSRELATSGTRTAAAGREFLHAVVSDLAALAARLKRALTAACRWPTRAFQSRASSARASPAERSPAGSSWARASGRVLRHVGLCAGLVVVVGALAVSGAMLWALHDLPLDRADRRGGPADAPARSGERRPARTRRAAAARRRRAAGFSPDPGPGGAEHRGSPLLLPFRRRSVGHRAGGASQRAGRRRSSKAAARSPSSW